MEEIPNTFGDSGSGHPEGLSLRDKTFGFLHTQEDGNHAGFLGRKELLQSVFVLWG